MNFTKHFKTFLLITSLVFYFACERKCDSYRSDSLLPVAEAYFGVYKPGNWWVYVNSTEQKKIVFTWLTSSTQQ